MANTIKLKRGSGSDPSASDLSVGELAIRTDEGKIFTKKDNGTVAEISGGGGVSDGDKGDITVSNSGATWTIDADAVTYAKIQNVSATNRILGRDSSGAGVIEEISPSSLRTMINVEDGATADQSASEILTLLKTVDGSGSGLDADTLDGISQGSFFRADADDTATHFHTASNLNSTGDGGLGILSGKRLGFDQSGTRSWTIKAASGNLIVASGDGSGAFQSALFQGSGASLTSLPAGQLTGTVAAARLDTATTQSAGNNSTKIATTAYTDTAISNLVDSSPSALNTLNELAAALGDDANFSTTVTNSIATKAVLTGSTNNTICTVTGANAIQGEAGLTFDGSILKLLNASAPQIRINNDTSDGSSTRLLIGKATASNNFFNGAASGDSCISAPTNLLLGNGSTERLRIDESGNVGINQTNPSAYGKFVVNGTGNVISLRASSGAGSLGFFEGGTGRFYIKTLNGSDGLSFVDGDGSSERLRITSDGKVGIGTTSPQRALHLSSNNTVFALTDTAASTDEKTKYILSDAGVLAFGKLNDAYDTADTQLLITNDGKVGIGTDNPGYNLDIKHGTSARVAIDCSTGSDAAIIMDGINADFTGSDYYSIKAQSTGEFAIFKASAERLRISSGGNVGISTTSPSAKLHVLETASTPAVKIKSGTSTNQNTHITLYNDNDGGTLAFGVFGSSANTHGAITATDGFVTSNQELVLCSQNNSGAIKFGVGSTPTERLRITSAGNLKVPDNAKIELGGAQTGSGDLSLYHDGSNSYIDNAATGDLFVRSTQANGDVNIVCSASNGGFTVKSTTPETMINATANGAVELYFQGSKRFQTEATGCTILQGSGAYGLNISGSNNGKMKLSGANDPYIRFQEGSTDKAYIQWSTSGFLQLVNTEDGSRIRLKDDIQFTQDGSTYHKIWHAGNDGAGSGLDADLWDGDQKSTYLNQAVLTSSSPTFTNIYSNDWLRNNASGKGLYNTSTGQHFYSDHDDYWNIGGGTGANGIRFRDEHGGTIRGYVYANNSNQVGLLDGNGQWCVRGIKDDTSQLFYDSTVKLSTKGWGVRIDDNCLGINTDVGNAPSTRNAFIALGDSDTGVAQNGDGQLELWANNQEIMNIDTGEVTFYKPATPGANNTYDLGSTSYRWRNLYINDLQLSNEGSQNSVDGTWGDWTLQEGESDVFMINNRSGKKYKMALQEVS